jgi:hypothetical protein
MVRRGERGGEEGDAGMAGYLMPISITCARLKEYTSYTCTNTYVVKHVVLYHWLIFVLARCQVPFAIFGEKLH